MFKLYDPVRKFALFNNSFQQAMGASSEIFRFMDIEDEVREKPERKPLAAVLARASVFERVSFSYDEQRRRRARVLHEIDLEVKAGEVLAIVGSSGAGKSTLVHLIPRFFDVTGGRILIDGHDVRDVTLGFAARHRSASSRRKRCCSTTRCATISPTDSRMSRRKDVEAAARAALAHDFILEMPEGYDTMIGERGLRLSGGERQRIAIARAILKNAPILILDEATSALDSESESLVQSALQNLMVGVPCL